MRRFSALALTLALRAGIYVSTAFRLKSQKKAKAWQDRGGQAALQELFMGSDHALGLEGEHRFEMISHHVSNASGWRVTERDKPVLDNIIQMLNPPGVDSAFAWQDASSSEWTFGLVKLTAQTPTGSLALHMLHRHGLAPLLASRAGPKFDAFMQLRQPNRSTTQTDLEFLVESEEEYETVKALRALLEQLSLSALRNLHSYDHQWSVDSGTGKIPGCSQRHASACILQAGRSRSAWEFLAKRHSVTTEATRGAQKAFNGLMKQVVAGATGLRNATAQRLDHPLTTGAMHPFVEVVDGDDGRWFLTGTVQWEDTGAYSRIHAPIAKEAALAIVDLPSGPAKRSFMQVELERWAEAAMAEHKAFMLKHRLQVWANEEAEFSAMYPRYLEAMETGDKVTELLEATVVDSKALKLSFSA